VATLTTAAQAARTDAARLRSQAEGLRLAVHRNLARSRERIDKAQHEAGRARAARAIPLTSPWSGLECCREDEQLGRVLVTVD
jgi:hypothetical protein